MEVFMIMAAEFIVIVVMVLLALLVLYVENIIAGMTNLNRRKEIKAIPVEQIPDFAHYQIELDVNTIDSQEKTLSKGTFVRNIYTGKVSTVSGNLIALLHHPKTAKKIADQVGLRLYLNPITSLVTVYEVPENGDILNKYNELIKLQEVKQVSIEVLEPKDALV